MSVSTTPFQGRSIWPLWRSNAKRGKRSTMCSPLCPRCSSTTWLSHKLLRLHHQARPLFVNFLIWIVIWNNWALYNIFDNYFNIFVYCIFVYKFIFVRISFNFYRVFVLFDRNNKSGQMWSISLITFDQIYYFNNKIFRLKNSRNLVGKHRRLFLVRFSQFASLTLPTKFLPLFSWKLLAIHNRHFWVRFCQFGDLTTPTKLVGKRNYYFINQFSKNQENKDFLISRIISD